MSHHQQFFHTFSNGKKALEYFFMLRNDYLGMRLGTLVTLRLFNIKDICFIYCGYEGLSYCTDKTFDSPVYNGFLIR